MYYKSNMHYCVFFVKPYYIQLATSRILIEKLNLKAVSFYRYLYNYFLEIFLMIVCVSELYM